MPGESQQVPRSEPDPSVITTEQMLRAVDNLEKQLSARIDDMRTMLDERYRTQTKAVDAALAAQQTAMQTAFTASQQAVDKALAAAEKAVDQRATTLDREFHEHLDQVRHENALAFLNTDKAVQAALASAEKAVNKAEDAANKRFESVNEFRAQLSDQAGTFMTRVEADAVQQRNAERINDLTDRLNKAEGKSSGYSTLWGAAVAGIGLIISVVVVVNVLVAK